MTPELQSRLSINAINTLNAIPKNSKNWLPLLSCVANGIQPQELSPFVKHGTHPLSESLCKASKIQQDQNPLFATCTEISEKKKEKLHQYKETPAKSIVSEFLVDHTRIDKHSNRLITKV
jgi:hypothetical protein